MAGNSTEVGRSVTSKITSILLTFTEGSEHSLTEIARLAGLPISTAHRLTSELASWRLLERTEDGHYRAGLPLRMIGTVDACPPSIAERAPCVLEDLVRRHPEPGPARRAAGARGRLHREAARPPPGHRVHSRPPPCPPTRRRWAARCWRSPPPGAVEMTIMRGLRPYTPHTITSPDRFRRALAVTRLTRVAVTRWRTRSRRLRRGDAGVRPGRRGGRRHRAGRRATWATTCSRCMAALSIASRSLSRELAGGEARHGAIPAQARPLDAALAAGH